MKRLFRGSVVLAVAVGSLSCSGDPTGDFRQPSGIIASPTSIFVNVGETEPVVVSLIDDQGNQIAADFEISGVGSGVTVVQDTAFLHTNTGGPIQNQAQFQVTGTAIANSSFTLSAQGQSLVVPVRVTPATVSLAISNPTPAWGDTITITAPAGALFTAESEVTFAGGPPADIVSLSADRTVLTVVTGPNVSGAVTISHTTVAFDETLDFTITSTETVTTPALTEVAGTFSTQTPALGVAVTLTLPAGIKVIPASVTAAGGLTVDGAPLPPADIVVAADSGSITFVPSPSSDSVVTINGVVPQLLPQFPQILSTTGKVTTPRVDDVDVTFSDLNPDVLEQITVTAPAGFTFDPTVTFTWGALAAIIGSVAPDGSSATITPLPGSAGTATIAGVIVAAAPQFVMTLPSVDAVTVPPVTPLEGTDSPATAPEITLPGPGGSVTVNDAGSYDYPAGIFGGAFGTFASRLYKIVVPATLDLTVEVDWPTGQDLGVYYFNEDGVGEPAFGNPADCCGAGVHPETSTSTLLAGTYLLAVVNFSTTGPPVFSLTLSR
jgi:hypothetical protein